MQNRRLDAPDVSSVTSVRIFPKDINILLFEKSWGKATDIQDPLRFLGYRVEGIVRSYSRVLQKLKKGSIDLIILNAQIIGKESSKEIIDSFYQDFQIPIVFLMDHSYDINLKLPAFIYSYEYITESYGEVELDLSIRLALLQHKYLAVLNQCMVLPVQQHPAYSNRHPLSQNLD